MSKTKVLIPIDDSQFSLQILPFVQKFLNPEQNELVLLRVSREPETIEIPQMPEDAVIYADQLEDSIREQFVTDIAPVAKQLQAAGYTVTADAEFGKPAQTIETLLDYQPFDLIAMATHGRTGLNRLVLGSVAEHVLRHSHVPVLLFHPGQ